MDKAKASAVLDKMIKEVGSCGLYYEIHISRLTKAVRDHYFELPEEEKLTFLLVATEDYNIQFDEESYKEILKSEAECWEQIRKEQDCD